MARCAIVTMLAVAILAVAQRDLKEAVVRRGGPMGIWGGSRYRVEGATRCVWSTWPLGSSLAA